MSVGPLTASPAAKTNGSAVWRVTVSATSVPPASVASCAPNALVSGRMPIAAMITSQAITNSLPGIGSGRRRPEASGLAERHPRAAQAAHRAVLVAEDLGRRDLEAEGHALALGVVGLDVVGGHLLAAAPVGDGHGRGAEAASGPRGVHRDVAAADDHDPPAR